MTPVSKDARGVWTYLIDLQWVDQNNKHRKVYKQLPVLGQLTIHTSDNEDDTSSEMFFEEDGGTEGNELVPSYEKAIKRIANGQLIIEKNGRTFNAIGAEIK